MLPGPPCDDALVRAIVEEYGAGTGLPVDYRVTRGMTAYYTFAWTRYRSSVAHAPAAILEMGFLTNPQDRATLVERVDLVAGAVVRAILRFFDEVPPGAAFAEDLVLPAFGAPVTPRP